MSMSAASFRRAPPPGVLIWALSMQRAISHAAHQQGVSTWLLRYRHRGWNDHHAPSPVPDARFGVVAGFGMIVFDRGLCSGAAILARANA